MPGQQTTRPSSFEACAQLYTDLADIEFERDLMDPPTAAELQQPLPTGSKVLMRMFERQLLEGLLLRLGQFNGTSHRQTSHQKYIACQTHNMEIVCSSHLLEKEK